MATLSGTVIYPYLPRVGERFVAYITVIGSGPTRSTSTLLTSANFYLVTDIVPGYVQIKVVGGCDCKDYIENTFLAAGDNHRDIYLERR